MILRFIVCLFMILFLSLFRLTKGSIATEYSDVGRYAEEDRCCREHDLWYDKKKTKNEFN